MINPWNFTDPSSTYIQIHFACILIYHIDILYIHICVYIYVCMYICIIYILMCISNIFIYIYTGALLREVLWWMSTSGASPWPARASRGRAAAGQCGAPHQGTGNVVRATASSLRPGIKELRDGHEKMKLQVIVYIHILSYYYTYIGIYIYMCVYIIELHLYIARRYSLSIWKKTYIFIYIRLYIYIPAIYELSITYSLGWP